MVRIIPFGVLLKLWASGQSDTFFCSFWDLQLMFTNFAIHLPLRQAKSFSIYAENFHPGVCVNGKHPISSDEKCNIFARLGSFNYQSLYEHLNYEHDQIIGLLVHLLL